MSSPNPADTLRLGIQACFQDDWRSGLTHLTRLAQREEKGGKLPGYFYSFLGVAMARCEGRKREGVELCRHAVEIEPFQPENYVNLANSYLLLRNRRAALKAIRQGLRIVPSHRRLNALAAHLGKRRRPPFSFLDRRNLLNRASGRLRAKVERILTTLRRGNADDGEF